MFRIMKKFVCETKKLFLIFQKRKLWASKVEISWAWKNVEQNSFYSSQWIKSQKMIRIMKKTPVKFLSKSDQENVENSEIGPDSETSTSTTREPVDLSFNRLLFI